MQTKILIAIAALAATAVTFASLAPLTGIVSGPQPVLSANNGGDGGP